MISFNAFLNACELQALSYNIAELSRNVWCLLEEKRCQLLWCQKTSAHRVKCWNIHQNNKRRLCFTVENCRKSLNTQGRCVITLPVLGFPVCIQTKWTVNTVVCVCVCACFLTLPFALLILLTTSASRTFSSTALLSFWYLGFLLISR